jgi:uroporphyrinogen decarboxylase
MGQVTGHPLGDIDRLNGYRWPKAADKDFSRYGKKEFKHGDRYIMLDGGMTLFERMIDLRGFEEAMADIAEPGPAFYEIRDRIVDYNISIIDRLLEYGPDGIYLSDDWGSQISLMINPEHWRTLFLPCYIRMFERIRQAGKHVFFHTDGYTADILPDLVKAGADVFWADLTVNPLSLLKEELGGKVCFQGLTDVQFTMRWGTPAEVEAHGKALIKDLGDFNGGFIACSEADPDQPWENIKSIYETFHRFGAYPLII